MDTHIREIERHNIMEVLCNYEPFNKLSDNEKKNIVDGIEIGINNTAIDRAMLYGIHAYWDDPSFIDVYNSISYNIKINADVNSSVNKDGDDKSRYYFIRYIMENTDKLA